MAAIPPPTIAPPIQGAALAFGVTATLKPAPVRTIATTNENAVRAML
jgi:hypothetical protein